MSDVSLLGSFGGSETATSSEPGMVKKNRWQQKLLAVNVTADASDISTTTGNSDFKFTGLTVGQHYELKLNCVFSTVSGDGSVSVGAVHGTNSLSNPKGILRVGSGNRGSTTISHPSNGSVVFKAEVTSVTFSLGSVSSGTVLVGGVDTEGNYYSYAELIERNDLEDEVSIW